jgi:DNA-binding transcriptional regulator YhcF (GntR family)
MLARTMLIRVDPKRTSPLFAQVAADIRRAVAEGEIGEGERLPPVRVLADSLGVNMHTIARAYRDLATDGLIELRQGRGAIVLDGGARRARALARAATKLLTEARRHGISPAQLAALVESLG